MNPKVEIGGRVFGSLRVIAHSKRTLERQRTHWICECECKRKLLVRSDNLRNGRSTQCSDCRGGRGRQSIFIGEDNDGELDRN